MKMYFSNNSRKLHKKPMNRKKDKRKRFYTRKETVEAINEFFDALNRR